MLQPRFLRAGERAPRLSKRRPAARGVLGDHLPFKATNARFSHITAAATWLPQSGSRIAARRVFCQQVASGPAFFRACARSVQIVSAGLDGN